MLPRRLEPEVMNDEAEARAYDAMDHGTVNRSFVVDFLRAWGGRSPVLDVATGSAQLPIALAREVAGAEIVGVDLSEPMLRLGRDNVRAARLSDRIRLERGDAKRLGYAAGRFGAVVCNAAIHHIPEPRLALAEIARVASANATIFVRDLVRPTSEAEVIRLVDLYAGSDADAQQKAMFQASFWAALTVEEVRSIVIDLGFSGDTVQLTSDRHWTWATRSRKS
jgi:ubiquinone/menaquinone biosynthesis C-methylase UbiE